ncbi:uncharacterized protein LAJ45_00808 [Morchella importuna]|uniref:uncharacterized protein n=1 Tax=Morchella importuna TaxID=1174673 RepID=UPI001E8D08C4|nr:uncharacterized protein LAJ45_00808 [Morchella importuna]KAH8155796.1 hypothetical protein LAJ45_00808 [Morchella importuna]
MIVLAQSTTEYTDPTTGIIFQRFLTSSYGGFSFGAVFPSAPTNEFIGQIVGPIGGWSGVSFGGGMNGNLLSVVWMNGNEIVQSFRMASGYLEPTVYSGTASSIPLYTSSNATHFSYTFRCVDCVTWTDGGFDPTADFTVMGWAQSTAPVDDPTDPASTFEEHQGFGQYGVILTSARQSGYEGWLAAAPTPTAVPTTTIAVSTTAPTATPTSTTVLGTYDYIVVGGGAAGLVVADRLSETGKSVLLIERGPPSTYKSGGTVGPAWLAGKGLTRFDVPGLCNQIWVDSAGIACNDIDQMAGCVLGGGTAVNAGLFFKPQDRDWNDNFPTGWKATDMVSATNKVFTRIPGTDNPSSNGVRYLQAPYTVLSSVLKTAGWSEVTANSVPNQKNRTFSHSPFMYANGERGGPLATYLQTAKARSNFAIAVNTTVIKTLRTAGHITGVQVTPSSTTVGGKLGVYNVTPTTGRVILSAGAFGTPKILFRSGIGPTDQLNVVKSSLEGAAMQATSEWIRLPVGYNVLDHTNTDMVFSHASVTSYDFYAAYDNPNTTDMNLYLNQRAGILATAAPGPNTMLWESFLGTDGITRQLQWTARSEGSLGQEGTNLVTMSQYLGTGVTSRGRMTITSSLNMQISTSPFLRDAADIDVVVRGVQSVLNAARDKGGITFIRPAAGVTAQEYVNSYVDSRRSNHWIGTCKMGTDSGLAGDGTTGSVVDANTKVYGTDNLFVVDASIFPGHVTTNPSAPIMIAAEKAVEKILALATGSTTPVPQYSQCGGINYVGSTVCATGYTCTVLNPYYYQCL